MCKSRMSVNASSPNSSRTRSGRTHSTRTTSSTRTGPPASAATAASASASASAFSSSSASSNYNIPSTSSTTSGHYRAKPSSSSLSSRTSLSSLRESLPDNPHIYDISEIRVATNNFLARRQSSSASSTPSWRCNLRGRDCVIFQRKVLRKLQTEQLREMLSVICRSHHMSIAKLLGVSISGDHIYLVYAFVEGANLADCLRNSKNPNFTVLSSWMSRIQIATDLAHGLDYIHNNTGLHISLVHKHIKSSSVVVTEPSINAKICHFGTAQLCGQVDENDVVADDDDNEIKSALSGEETELKKLKRPSSGTSQFEGVRGYMSPEFQMTGIATQKSDVYAFGVVILELLSGEEPYKYKFDRVSGDFVRTSVIDTARAAVDGGDAGGGGTGGDGVDARLRRWVDRRLKDSFPVEVAGKVTRLALDCVHVDPNQRPNMGRVAGKISKLYLESRIWFDNIKMPTDFSVSLAPR